MQHKHPVVRSPCWYGALTGLKCAAVAWWLLCIWWRWLCARRNGWSWLVVVWPWYISLAWFICYVDELSAFCCPLLVQLCNEFGVSFSFFLHSGARIQKTTKDCWCEIKVPFVFLYKLNKIRLHYCEVYVPQMVCVRVNKFWFFKGLVLSWCPQFALNSSGIWDTEYFSGLKHFRFKMSRIIGQNFAYFLS